MTRNAIPTLKQITAIRALQKTAAEGEAMAAATLLRTREDSCTARNRERDEAVTGWDSCIAAGAFAPEVLRTWSAGIRTGEAAASAARSNADAASRECERRAALAHRASMLNDATRKLLMREVAKQSYRRAERALLESVGRRLQRHGAL